METALYISDLLGKEGIGITVANMRFVKPIDERLIDELTEEHELIITMEENVRTGGFGDAVLRYINDSHPDRRVINFALPDDYVEHGSVAILRKETGIDREIITERIRKEVCGQ